MLAVQTNLVTNDKEQNPLGALRRLSCLLFTWPAWCCTIHVRKKQTKMAYVKKTMQSRCTEQRVQKNREERRDLAMPRQTSDCKPCIDAIQGLLELRHTPPTVQAALHSRLERNDFPHPLLSHCLGRSRYFSHAGFSNSKVKLLAEEGSVAAKSSASS